MGKGNALKVAIYCRVATESQMGIKLQKESLTQYARSLGYSHLAYYMDNGASGLILDRPGFRQMEADMETGTIGAVLAKDISRIGRDMWQVGRWLNGLKGKGVTFLTSTPPYQPLTLPTLESVYKAYTDQRRKKRR